MEPYTIARTWCTVIMIEELDSDYSSATAIRSLLAYSSSSFNTEPVEGNYDELSFSGILSELENQVPKCCLELLKDYHKVQYPISQNDFSLILKYKLLLVVSFAGNYTNSIVLDKIYNSVTVIINSSAPKTT